MPVPELSDEERRAALSQAAAARKKRAELKDRVRAGEVGLAEVLAKADADDTIGKTRVTEMLEAFPRVGKVTARTIMRKIDISPSRRLRGLGVRQREKLLAEFARRFSS